MALITIVGVGALGSHVVQFLRNVDSEIKVVDFDRVEMKNVKSQFHSSSTIGKLKAPSLQQTVNFLFKAKITSVPAKLVTNNVDQLLGGSNLVIDCLDNGEARRLVQGYVRWQKIPCLHGALAANGAFGQVLWDKVFRIDDEAGAGAATCEDGEHLPFIALVSSLLAHAAKTYMVSGKELSFQIHPTGVISV